MAHKDTTKAGQAATANHQNAELASAKAGSPLGASGTYSDVPNSASPDAGTIARNQINAHPGSVNLTGSTSDTGRKQP